jgi:hypothetical protein
MTSLQPRVVINLECSSCAEIGEDVDLHEAKAAGWAFDGPLIDDAEKVILVGYSWAMCPHCTGLDRAITARGKMRAIYRDKTVRKVMDKLEAHLAQFREAGDWGEED